MNGVSRFLSRRDKHHEKRQTKHARSKVPPPLLFPPASPPRPISPVDGAASQDSMRACWLRPCSLQSLYHRLPSILQPAGQDSFLFLRKTPFCADLRPYYVHVSTIDSSDHLKLQSRHVPTDMYTIFSNEELKITEKDGEKKVQTLIQRLKAAGITSLGEAQAQYALSWYPDDLDKAYDVLLLANDSFDGILKDYNPPVHMLGAVNRNMVTCYLDALLFAMFARLDSFEAMLFDNFSDEPRKKLAGVLRLWVNLLRTGRLIRVDLTKHLQDSLAECGWEEAAKICQQDASEAFTFITGALELPLLTLKMDIYHTGREDKEDDHKFVNERLLEVAIPEQEADKVVTLEDCLETYFNNRIEVKRYLQRQNTLSSIRQTEHDTDKGQVIHIETLELTGSESPMASTPTTLTPVSPIGPTLQGRRRADSIFTERYTARDKIDEEKHFDEKKLLDEMLNSSSSGRPRASSFRKEVMMPAWQFFSLIPWYTDNIPKSDAQVAAHFSAKRPVLGICLKRYTMLPNGTPKRLDTYIDIPLEIGLPHFISDDRMKEEGPLFGNFKLVLQSVVCHRGVSVDSGHYISLVRANLPPHNDQPGSPNSFDDVIQDSWLRFDDLANPRVSNVDIKKALRDESPYLLFYQVQPIDEELASRGDPPSYSEVQSELPTADPSSETLGSVTTDPESGADWDKITSADFLHLDSGNSDDPVGRSSMSSNRQSSIAFEDLDSSIQSLSRGRTQPPTPDEQRPSFLSTSRRNSRTWMGGSKSRPSSQSGENRLSFTISRLTGRGSKDRLQPTDNGTHDDPVIVINEVQSEENGGQDHSSVKESHKDSGVGRSKSKRGKDKKEEKKRMRSKSRDPSDHRDKGKGKEKEKSRPDRECVVM
ncbi:ubiquitin C-terminal hydrolase family protein [Melanomma pulvis-pyrius CBS 109.77]|uniref:ubiquitinyl hydrolase 1 n=1 Tax=Melanomma pulvis-pyrius CBS 109.77 TaxID=1314802 RepID=A0A6A6X0B2_9PLEO|nr:ubiquitin C-terminal hydrolase family protein [Melanomma pulvis-pyrius CBS 109.77]